MVPAVVEITIVNVDSWVGHARQLAPVLARRTERGVIPDPSGGKPDPHRTAVVTAPEQWARIPAELAAALELVAGGDGRPPADGTPTAPGVAPPGEERLVYTVQEAADRLGISRAFAYEAVRRGDIPSIRIGRRILVPKVRLEEFLATSPEDDADK